MPEKHDSSEAVAATPKRAEDAEWAEASIWTFSHGSGIPKGVLRVA